MKKLRLLSLLMAISLSSLSAQALENLDGPAKSCPIKAIKDGKEISLSVLKGKVVYLDFWASWCRPCALSFPYMNELSKKYRSDGLELVAVSLDESKDEANSFLSQHPVDFSIAHDPEGECPKAYGVQTMPTSYLVDRKGNLRYTHRGFNSTDRNEIDAAVIKLLQEK
jgi:thiol-disulfide isomerase/thioredoxin